MTKRRPDPLPTPEQLRSQIVALVADAAGIPRWYAKAYELGLDPRGGSDVHVASGPSDYVPAAAVDNLRAAQIRNLCRAVAAEVRTAEVALGNARVALERYIAPSVRQAPRDRAHATITEEEFRATLERRARGEQG